MIVESIRLVIYIASLLLVTGSACAAELTLAERLGYGSQAKLLIVHADDIGVSHSVNGATFAALQTGLVNSGSIMVPCPWFPEAAEYFRANPQLDLGLHLTLTSEWRHLRWSGVLTDAAATGLHDADGYLYRDVPGVIANASAAAVARELRAQVDRALAFGIQPTHLDSHMGTVFASPEFFAAYLEVGRDYKLPVLVPRERIQREAPQLASLLTPEDLTIDWLFMADESVPMAQWDSYYSGVLQNLQPGVTEIIIHLAYDDAEMQAVTIDHPDYGAAWRQADFDFFTSERFASLLRQHDVELVTWREIGRLL